MVEVLISMVRQKEAEDILSPSKPIRSLDYIILDIANIRDKGHMAINLDDAKRLEVLGLELIRHARETLAASY